MNRESIAAIHNLSSEKREQLRKLLRTKGVDLLALPVFRRPADLAVIPTSFAQQRLWFLDQLEPGSPVYNVPTTLRLSGRLDAEVLARALNEVVRRHDGLRTTFSVVDDMPVQVVAPALALELPQTDLSALPHAERTLRAEELARQEAWTGFDLAAGPLVRARLLRMSEEEHILLLTVHHIVTDAWSMGVLVREAGALYAAYALGEPSPLAPLQIQYADYAHWQRCWLGDEVLQTQVEYWAQQLADAPAMSTLPTDRARPPMQTHRGTTLVLRLPARLTAGLHAVALQAQGTLFMVLAAAFNVLLWRHTGQDDLCIGMPVASRTRAELEPLIGLFVNTLVLRTLMRRGATFSELLHQVKGTTLDAYAHQDVPFEQLVEVLRPQRNTAYSPLFQVMLTLQNAPAQADEPAGLRFESLGQENTQAKFDLTLNITEEGEQLKTEFEYNTDLFDASTIERLAGHFSRLLEGVAADPQQRIGQLPLLDDAERHRVLVQWNDTAAEYPHKSTIHDLFEQQATRTPDAIAVVFEGASLTYRELNARANRIAHHLITLGVGAGDCVALALPRSDDLVAAELAVLKCGAAYVPLDLEHPTERLHFMLADCAARVLVCRSHCSLLGLTRLEVDRLAEPSVYTDPQRPVHPQAGAYVMYTSGSTGTPKGVMVAHQAVVKLVMNNGYARFDASDRVAFAANPAFDASTMEVWAPLLHGGAIVVIEQGVLLDAAAFALALQRHAVSVLFMTIGLFHQYAPLLGGAIRQLRYLMVGGDLHDPRVFEQVLRASPPRHLLHVYGPTETTTFAMSYDVREVPPAAVSLPLGGPIANTRIYILDGRGMPVPVGVRGEIHIGGAGVARGYLGRPDLTAERFLPDPYVSQPGARMYRTGDVGRWRPDGTIEFLGRNDHQVKIRGFRIELGEIEARLREHPEVRDAVVLAREDSPGHKRLVAYVTAPSALAPEALREHLGSRLPEFMVPAAYVQLDAWPLTRNGKLDRQALPAPQADAFGSLACEPPQGEPETTLETIWTELLDVERIGRHDSFFALGGHSLLAVQLTSRIRARLGCEMPLAELFAHPTLAAFAQRVAVASASTLPAMVPVPREEAPPLSYAQQRLWFLAQLDERASAAYLMPAGVRLIGALDVAALQGALDRVVARHEALRTCFASIDGTPVQVISPPEAGFALRQVNLSEHAQPEAEFERLAAEEAMAPFDLEHGPLIRGHLLRLADDDHVLLVTMHHIVSDGWSAGVLLNEFSALYAAFSQGRPDPLPPLPIQYADYAVWQRRWITGEVLQRQLDFWRNHLGGAPALLELPTDRPRPAVQDYTGASFGFELDAELTAHLKALSQRHGSTLFMTLLAAWAALLSRLSGQSDVVIGTPVANRHHAEIEPLIGFFVNTQALRVDLSGSPSVAELLGQVRATALAAQEHQDIPFEQVVEALSPTRSMAHSPIFQVWFAWQNAPEGSLDLPGLQLEPVGASSTTARFDLELILHDAGERIAGSLGYACGLFDRSSVERHLAHWQTLLRGLVADDSACVARLPLLTEPEQQHLLIAFNNTATPFPHERCIHQLFEEQVDRTPEATALVFEDTLLTYSELNALANRIAHQLIAVGVRKNSRVAIALPRGIDMVVALLATLKAGGAYVPLDPDYPAERLAYMLDDCRPRVVLTHTAVQERLPASRALLTATVLELDDSGNWAHQPTHNPEPAELGLMPSHLAYVIYTSGSTGLPKGVMVAHRNAVHIWAALERGIYAYHGGIERVSLNASLSFDASVQQWVQLASGRTLVIVPDSARRDATALLKLIATERIDAFDCTPSQLQLIHSAWASAAWRAPTLALVGGEAIDPALWGTLAGSTDTRYYNVYGPTECTVDSTIAFIQTTAVAPHIGRPVANARIYILDKFGAPVAVGMAGELYISGGGVTRGYLGRPDLTAERFVPDPFGEPGSRMYKTGDLGRWRPDGTIEFLGRNDHQVKIRGFRIELGEIEAALRSHPEVRDAAVLAREDMPGDKRLVAYVVGEATPEVLRQHLGSRLPEYMVPAAYVALDLLPLTANGKLDRRALPSPEEDALGARTYESPQGEMETLLARLWSELLGLERIGRQEDFFTLGGHSLLAVQLTSRIRATLGQRHFQAWRRPAPVRCRPSCPRLAMRRCPCPSPSIACGSSPSSTSARAPPTRSPAVCA
jgi:amino acid adenylation domain-containing protein